MKKDILLLTLFFIVVVGGFVSITLSVAKVFVSSVNSITTNYTVDANGTIKE